MQKGAKIKINEENCKSFGNGRKVMKLWIITPQFKLKKQNKQTKESTNLINRFMWEKELFNPKKRKQKNDNYK